MISPFQTCCLSFDNNMSDQIKIHEKIIYFNLHFKNNNRLLEKHLSCDQIFPNKKRQHLHLDNVGTLMVYNRRTLSIRWRY